MSDSNSVEGPSSPHSSVNGDVSRSVIKTKTRRINLDLILSSTSLTRSSKETSDAYLKRVTHLHLQNKKIGLIENLDDCKNLKVLYLYDNLIEKIENLDFAAQLQYLYLQNNNISEIPDLTMPNLTKLFLEENNISFVAGLDDCVKLEELTIGKQRLPLYSNLQFDGNSLDAISRSLKVLDISEDGISILTPFTVLQNLRKFICDRNLIVEISEVESMICLPLLEEASFQGNPCCNSRKYRDYAIGASSEALRILDGEPVLKHQQIAIRGLTEHRRRLGTVH